MLFPLMFLMMPILLKLLLWGVPADASHEAIPNETTPTEVIAEGDNEAANPSQV